MKNQRFSRGYQSEDDLQNPNAVGAGLWNLLNNCFINSILQCLTHTVPLVEKLRALDHKHPRPSGDVYAITDEYCILQEMKDHFKNCLSKSGEIHNPITLFHNMNKLSSDFEFGEQADAHEYLQCLLNSLQECCSGDITGSQVQLWEQEDSIIEQVFGCLIESQLQCCDCGRQSRTYEPVRDLSLAIDDVDNLEDALKSFTKVEMVDAETKFTCSSCKNKVSMSKQLKLVKIPQVVTLHLKRFKMENSTVHKIDKFVKFPETLNLQPFVNFPEDELCYELYAIVVHEGRLDQGHYYSIIRSSEASWHAMNDSQVFKISKDRVFSLSPYILFYIKRGSAPWPSSMIERPLIKSRAPKRHPQYLNSGFGSRRRRSAMFSGENKSRKIAEDEKKPTTLVAKDMLEISPLSSQMMKLSDFLSNSQEHFILFIDDAVESSSLNLEASWEMPSTSSQRSTQHDSSGSQPEGNNEESKDQEGFVSENKEEVAAGAAEVKPAEGSRSSSQTIVFYDFFSSSREQRTLLVDTGESPSSAEKSTSSGSSSGSSGSSGSSLWHQGHDEVHTAIGLDGPASNPFL